jgi:lactoylglutathione lyase
VQIVPRGHRGIQGVGVRIVGRDQAALAHFYGAVLQLEDAGNHTFRCGDSLLFLEEDPAAPQDPGIYGRGYRYLTIQIFDCEAEHARILRAGAREGMPPRHTGDVAIFSMVMDPSGNWIEISQRASLTGPLG